MHSNLDFKVYHKGRTEIEEISSQKDLLKKQITIEKKYVIFKISLILMKANSINNCLTIGERKNQKKLVIFI